MLLSQSYCMLSRICVNRSQSILLHGDATGLDEHWRDCSEIEVELRRKCDEIGMGLLKQEWERTALGLGRDW